MAGLDFLEFPSTPHSCLNGMSDHGSWTWGNKANSRVLRQSPTRFCVQRGHWSLAANSLFSAPPFLYSSIIRKHRTL